jgi:hypothetical protein
MSDEMLDLALAYLDRHLYTRYIFPIKAGAKFPPLVKDNLGGNASNDPEQIRAWAAKWPGCNWAVAHRKSNLLVVDVDCNEAKGKVGRDTFEALALAYDWPDTETTTTPSGGFHLVYEGQHIFALGENGIGKDIDSPNYTLIAGCGFADGTRYVGNDADSVACPAFIYDLIRSSKTKSKIADAGEAVVELDQEINITTAIDFLQMDAVAAIEGQGGDFNTLKTAMYLKDLGISPEMAFDLMDEYYNPRCEPPWDRDGLERKIGNAYTYSSLSKLGGKTAEADFSDDLVEDFEPMGDPAQIELERGQREQARTIEADRAAARPETVATVATVETDETLDPSRLELIKKWVWVSGIERFVWVRNPDRMWKKSSFDAHYAYMPKKGEPKSISECLFRQRKGTIEKFVDVAYKPGGPRSAGGAYNTYRPSGVVPIEGDITWWDEHLAYLFANEIDRSLVLNWLAWLLQNLDKKPKHALLMQGAEQGTGKSFIADMFARILGARNVSRLSQSDLHGDFNGWAGKSKLILIEELRALDRTEVANKLHPLITQDTVSINEKNLPRRDMDNCFGIFAMTNHDAAITLDQSDRRYLVVNTPVKPRPYAYYERLYARLNRSADVSAVFYALMNRDVGAYNGAAAAPRTEAKEAMIDAGSSDLEQFLNEAGDMYPLNGRVISVNDVISILPKRLEGRSPRLFATVRAVIMRKYRGVDLGPIRTPTGERPRLIAINGKDGILQGMSGAAIGALYEADKEKAGKGETLDLDSASSDFNDPFDESTG